MEPMATFTLVQTAKIGALRRAAQAPRRRFLGWTRDPFAAFLQQEGTPGHPCAVPGRVIPILFRYLQEDPGVDFLHGEYDDLAGELTRARGRRFYVLSTYHVRHLDRLDRTRFSPVQMGQYFRAFDRGHDDEHPGHWMLAAVETLATHLRRLEAGTMLLVAAG